MESLVLMLASSASAVILTNKRHGDGASVVMVEGAGGEFAVDRTIASCAGGLLGYARQGAVGEACDSAERAGDKCKYSVLLNGHIL